MMGDVNRYVKVCATKAAAQMLVWLILFSLILQTVQVFVLAGNRSTGLLAVGYVLYYAAIPVSVFLVVRLAVYVVWFVYHVFRAPKLCQKILHGSCIRRWYCGWDSVEKESVYSVTFVRIPFFKNYVERMELYD